ncbi:MAG: 30S ribosomal protein S13 [Chloroflexi bacterium]|nr:30S ribosomal protein S13 [Chloroflexota bacterium]
MARIAGVDLPREKRIEVGLAYIYGVGPRGSRRFLEQTGIDPGIRVKDLTEEQVSLLRDAIDKSGILVEGELRRQVSMNIKRLIEIGSYRGLRHRAGLPAHGQRTRTNARTKRGPRKTVAGRRRATAKK